jgi:LuxR family maltose regulon positive regulatory protein
MVAMGRALMMEPSVLLLDEPSAGLSPVLQDEVFIRCRGFYPDIRPIAAMKTRVQIAVEDLSSAGEWAHDRRISVDDDPDYLHEYEHLTLARLLLAQHRAALHLDHGPHASPVVALLGLLDRMHARARHAGRDGSVLEIRILQALAHHAHGDVPQALALLGRSFVESPEPESYVRLYLDEGAPMLTLLHHAAGVGNTEDREMLQRHARRLLEAASTPAEGAEPPQPLADPLSQRELQVLQLLDSELTGPEIARDLYVSLNTLRTHTRRIFTKLDATTRAAAVRRARECGLL